MGSGCYIGVSDPAQIMSSCINELSRPLLGGVLARPSDRWPTVFTWRIWREFPYFLPCLAGALFVLICIIITVFFFQEVCLLFIRKIRVPY